MRHAAPHFSRLIWALRVPVPLLTATAALARGQWRAGGRGPAAPPA